MTSIFERQVRRFGSDRRGNVAMLFGLSAVPALMMIGAGVDYGRAQRYASKVQEAIDAGALAAANTPYATRNAAASTVINATLGSTGLTYSISQPTVASSDTTYRASVTLQVPTYFMSAVMSNMSITKAATAVIGSAGGATTSTTTTFSPLDLVIIVDTTSSMGSNGSDTSCSAGTSIGCALIGVQNLLKGLNPCSATLGCGTVTNGVAANPQSQVALVVFPPLSTAYDATGTTQQSKDYDCAGNTNPTTVKYNAGASSGSVNWKNYMVLPFQSDYRTSNTATTLNPASKLAIAVGGSSSCLTSKLATPGGAGTYYADAIAAATTYLTNNGRAGAKKAILLFSDGDAQSSYAPVTNYAPTTSATNASMTNSQCQAGIAAAKNAQSAKMAGTTTSADITVYTLAYGSATSGGCQDSTSLTGVAQRNVTPCNAMKLMSTAVTTNGVTTYPYFYTDAPVGGCTNSTVTANNFTNTTQGALTSLFAAVQTSMTSQITTTTTVQTPAYLSR